MNNTQKCQYKRKATLRKKAWDVLKVFLWENWILPLRWCSRLKHISVPMLLDEIETDIGQAGWLSLSPITLAWLVRLRIACTVHWRRKRCLLGSLLLLHYLARTQREITLHLQCTLNNNEQVSGHCWITGPQLKRAIRWMPSEGKDDIYRKTIRHPSCNNVMSLNNCHHVEDTLSLKDQMLI